MNDRYQIYDYNKLFKFNRYTLCSDISLCKSENDSRREEMQIEKDALSHFSNIVLCRWYHINTLRYFDGISSTKSYQYQNSSGK